MKIQVTDIYIYIYSNLLIEEFLPFQVLTDINLIILSQLQFYLILAIKLNVTCCFYCFPLLTLRDNSHLMVKIELVCGLRLVTSVVAVR